MHSRIGLVVGKVERNDIGDLQVVRNAESMYRDVDVTINDGMQTIRTDGDSVDSSLDNESIVTIRVDGVPIVTLYRVNNTAARRVNELCVQVWDESTYAMPGDAKGARRV